MSEAPPGGTTTATLDTSDERPRTRAQALLGNRRRLVIALALILVAAGVAVGSTAVFTSSAANPGNAFAAGDLQVGSDENGAILSGTGMVPGDSKQGTVTISNTGDVSGKFTLSSEITADTAGPNGGKLSDVLQLEVTEGPRQIYSGPIKGMGAEDLGTWPAGESHTYDFKVTFPKGNPPESDNAYQGSSTEIKFTWDAVST